jgi:hypothetical protein
MSRRRRLLRRLRRLAPFAGVYLVGYHLGRLDGQFARRRWEGGPIRVG